MASRKYSGAKSKVAQRFMREAVSSRNVGKMMKGVGYLGAVSAGINAASGNYPMAAGSIGLSIYSLGRRDFRVREAESNRLKSRAIDAILNKTRTGNTLGIRRPARSGGVRADAGSSARLALAKSAATRTAVATRTTSVLGRSSGRRVASAAPSGGNGQVKAYTRMLNGQTVFVAGYSRTV